MGRIRMVVVLTVVAVLGSAAVALAAHIEGTNGPDVLIGTPARDHIDARGGDDIIFGLGGGDHIQAGKGDDTIDGDGQCPPGATDPDYCQHGGGEGDHHHHHGHHHGHHGHHHNGCPPGTKNPDYCENVDGDDHIDAGPGRDSVRGGGGDDMIDVRDGETDTVDCGPGWDTVIADRQDVVSGNCERLLVPRGPNHGH